MPAPVAANQVITATATDVVAGNTSEFSAPVSVAAAADLSVTNSAPAAVTEGQQYTETISVTNNGPSDATNVTLTDTRGPNARFVLTSFPGGTITSHDPSAGFETINLGTIAAGATVTGTFTMQARSAGVATNNATVTSDVADSVSGNNAQSDKHHDPGRRPDRHRRADDPRHRGPDLPRRGRQLHRRRPQRRAGQLHRRHPLGRRLAEQRHRRRRRLRLRRDRHPRLRPRPDRRHHRRRHRQHGGSTATDNGSAVVAEAPISSSATNFAAHHGVTFGGPIGTLVDSNSLKTTGSAFVGSINWGDGAVTAATFTYNFTTHKFAVNGSHKYAKTGKFNVKVKITDGPLSTTFTSIANVA